MKNNIIFKYVLPLWFVLMALLMSIILGMAFWSEKVTDSTITAIVKQASLPDTIFVKRNEKDSLVGIAVIDKQANKLELLELKSELNNILDNNTITFLFTIFSIALLSAGAYLLALMQENVNRFKVFEHSSFNDRQALSMLFVLDFTYSLILHYNDSNAKCQATDIPVIRENFRSLRQIISQPGFNELDAKTFSSLHHKFEILKHKIEDVTSKVTGTQREEVFKGFNSDLEQVSRMIQTFQKIDSPTVIPRP